MWTADETSQLEASGTSPVLSEWNCFVGVLRFPTRGAVALVSMASTTWSIPSRFDIDPIGYHWLPVPVLKVSLLVCCFLGCVVRRSVNPLHPPWFRGGVAKGTEERMTDGCHRLMLWFCLIFAILTHTLICFLINNHFPIHMVINEGALPFSDTPMCHHVPQLNVSSRCNDFASFDVQIDAGFTWSFTWGIGRSALPHPPFWALHSADPQNEIFWTTAWFLGEQNWWNIGGILPAANCSFCGNDCSSTVIALLFFLLLIPPRGFRWHLRCHPCQFFHYFHYPTKLSAWWSWSSPSSILHPPSSILHPPSSSSSSMMNPPIIHHSSFIMYHSSISSTITPRSSVIHHCG